MWVVGVGRVQLLVDGCFEGKVSDELEFVAEIFEVVLW